MMNKTKFFLLLVIIVTFFNFLRIISKVERPVDLRHFLSTGKVLSLGYDPYEILLNHGLKG